LQESELNSEEQKSTESFTENSKDQLNESRNDIVEPIDNEDVSEKSNSNTSEQKSELNKDSLFKRILQNGFDGVTTNPNYKLLALLIILLINLSLFFLVGNLGKSFLKSSGLLG